MKLPGKWEFPGGKVEVGESPEHCIQREILEELNLIIRPVERLKDYFFDYNDFQITLIPFIADLVSGEIRLAEHQQYVWLILAELNNLDWAPADQGIVKDLIVRPI